MDDLSQINRILPVLRTLLPKLQAELGGQRAEQHGGKSDLAYEKLVDHCCSMFHRQRLVKRIVGENPGFGELFKPAYWRGKFFAWLLSRVSLPNLASKGL